MSTWSASYKPTAKTAPISTGIAAGDVIEAARDFARWREAHGVTDYYSVTFEPLEGGGVTVTPLHEHFSPERLGEVVTKMRQLGPPRIRAHFDPVSQAWYALEGTHRLRAALALGVPPALIPVRWSRGRKALERARHAAPLRGHTFARVSVSA